jgi:hypothetical protein
MSFHKNYLKELRKRAKESRVYRKHQLIGLEIAHILHDEKHKSLYIKLAKEQNPDTLLALAKEVAERTQVRNRGAYFMKLLTLQKKERALPRRSQYRRTKQNIKAL